MHPLRDPRGQEMRLPEFLSVPCIYIHARGRYVHIDKIATPARIRAYPPPSPPSPLALARSPEVEARVGLSPRPRGIRYDGGDNLRLYPRAGQRFN